MRVLLLLSVGLSSPVTVTAQTTSFTPTLVKEWNLLGNSLNATINVAATFGNVVDDGAAVAGVSSNVESVWKWNPLMNAGVGGWQFYTPNFGRDILPEFAESQGYEVLTTILPTQGYWVRLKATAPSIVTLPTQTGLPAAFSFSRSPVDFPGKPWNLIAVPYSFSPSEFNRQMTDYPPSPETPQVRKNVVSLWAWNAARNTWYFYASNLEAAGGLEVVKDFALSSGFLHFEDDSLKLGTGVGFWVNLPPFPGPPRNVSAVAGNGQAVVTFSAPTPKTDSHPITGYHVASLPSGGVDINSGTSALTHTVTGLANGVAYTFTVTAKNETGVGAASAPSTSVTPRVP